MNIYPNKRCVINNNSVAQSPQSRHECMANYLFVHPKLLIMFLYIIIRTNVFGLSLISASPLIKTTPIILAGYSVNSKTHLRFLL